MGPRMWDVEDVLVAGGGAAGYRAGLFAARDRGRLPRHPPGDRGAA